MAEWWAKVEEGAAALEAAWARQTVGLPADAPVIRLHIGDYKNLLTDDQMAAMQGELTRIFGEAGFAVVFTDTDFIYNLSIDERHPNPIVVGETPLESKEGAVRPVGTVYVGNLTDQATNDADS